MPLDPEVQDELDAIRRELRDELRSARTPREREAVRGEARADLEEVLRDNGYRLTRRELDEIIAQREDDRVNAAVERALAARDAAAAEEEEEEGEENEDGTPAKKPARKKPAAAKGDEEEEWT